MSQPELYDSSTEGYDDDYEDCEQPHDEIVRAKWIMDGATTLAEAADQVRAFANELQELHDEGYVFTQPVADDYGFYVKPGTKCAACGYVAGLESDGALEGV